MYVCLSHKTILCFHKNYETTFIMVVLFPCSRLLYFFTQKWKLAHDLLTFKTSTYTRHVYDYLLLDESSQSYIENGPCSSKGLLQRIDAFL